MTIVIMLSWSGILHGLCTPSLYPLVRLEALRKFKPQRNAAYPDSVVKGLA